MEIKLVGSYQSNAAVKVIRTLNSHNHDEDAREVEVLRITNTVKRRAETTMERPSQIIAEAARDAPAAVLPMLKHGNLQRLI